MNDGSKLLAAIDGFHPARGARAGKEWLELDELVQALAATDADPNFISRTLLGVFERFPRHDGYEVFWGLLHCLEDVPGYERHLIESVHRVPNHMSVTMLQRIVNSGTTVIDGIDLPALVRQAEQLVPEVDYTIDPPS